MPKPFPAEEGWIRATLTLTSKKPLSESEIKRIVSFGNPEKYEWARVEQYGAKLKIIYRDAAKSSEPASSTEQGGSSAHVTGSENRKA